MRLRTTLVALVAATVLGGCTLISQLTSDIDDPVARHVRQDTGDPSATEVTSVTVVPASGSREFTLNVAFRINWRSDVDPPSSIRCRLTDPSGQDLDLATAYPDRPAGAPADRWSEGSLPIQIQPKYFARPVVFGQWGATCANLDSSSQASTVFEIVEEAASPSATSAPGPGGDGSPLVIRGGGRWVDWSGEERCIALAEVVLVVFADGTADLTVNGPGYLSHVPCTPDPAFVVTYHITGTVQGETATFTACNDGSYDAEGTVTFAGETLAGSATCRFNRGDSAGSTDMQVLIP